MKSTSKMIYITLASMAFAASASAQNHVVGQYETAARLIEAKPLYVTKTGSHQECTEVQVQRSQERSNGGAVIGAIAGGLAGKSIGKGNGNTVATAAGAAIGAITGDRIQNDVNGYPSRKQCYLVQDPPMELPNGFLNVLEVNDDAGSHRVSLQTANPLRADQNGLVRIRVAVAINQ